MSILKWFAVPLFFEGIAFAQQQKYKKEFMPSSLLTPDELKEVIQFALTQSSTLKARYDTGTPAQKEEVAMYILYRFDMYHRAELGLE